MCVAGLTQVHIWLLNYFLYVELPQSIFNFSFNYFKKSILIFRFRSSVSQSIPGDRRETSRHPLLTFNVKDKGRGISEKKILQTKLKRKNCTAVELEVAAALFKILSCLLQLYFQQLKIGLFLFLISCSQTFCLHSRERRAYAGSARNKIKKPQGIYWPQEEKERHDFDQFRAKNKQRSCLNFSAIQKEDATRMNALHGPPSHQLSKACFDGLWRISVHFE